MNTAKTADDNQPGPTAFPYNDPLRDWSEDAKDTDNGCYSRACLSCGKKFVGHKRRVYCKACHHQPVPVCQHAPGPTASRPPQWMVDFTDHLCREMEIEACAPVKWIGTTRIQQLLQRYAPAPASVVGSEAEADQRRYRYLRTRRREQADAQIDKAMGAHRAATCA